MTLNGDQLARLAELSKRQGDLADWVAEEMRDPEFVRMWLAREQADRVGQQHLLEVAQINCRAAQKAARESFDRANEAAKLSADARDQADALRKQVAEQLDELAEYERQRIHRDAWAIQLLSNKGIDYPMGDDPWEVLEDWFKRSVWTAKQVCREVGDG